MEMKKVLKEKGLDLSLFTCINDDLILDIKSDCNEEDLHYIDARLGDENIVLEVSINEIKMLANDLINYVNFYNADININNVDKK